MPIARLRPSAPEYVERPGLDLHEIFSRDDFAFQFRADFKIQLPQGGDDAPTVLRRARGKNIHVLRRAGIAEQDRAAFADEKIFHALVHERTRDFLGLKWTKFPFHAARLKPRYSGRFASHHARYSAIEANARHGASSSTGL